MDMKIIFAPIIGAGIGYSTNWLAIKMLFRPYTEKRFLGIRLPFTPGLIPKERERIAKSIGEVIQDYLLTDKIIVDELLEVSTKEHVLKLINDNIYNDNGNIDLEQMLLSDDNKTVLGKLENILAIRLYDFLQEKSIKEKLQKIITGQLKMGLENIKLTDIITEQEMGNRYKNVINDIKTKDILINFLSGTIREDCTLNELFDEHTINNIKGLLIKYIDAITDDLKILENEKLKEKMVELIDKTIKEKVGALGAMFVNGESIYQTIVQKSKEKLREQEVKDEIYAFITNKIDEITNRPMREIIPDETRENLITWLSDYIPKNLAKIDFTSMIDINNNLYTLVNNLVGDDLEYKINDLVINNYEEMLNNENTIDTIKSLINTFFDNMRLDNISVTKEDKEKIDTFILNKYDSFVNNHLTKLIKDVKLSAIIEKQLNMFDIVMLEDIIISIAKKELNAITLLGGLLGFIISSLAVFL
jgi:uncharacterized membrane protein YheB (UPF0754 family)